MTTLCNPCFVSHNGSRPCPKRRILSTESMTIPIRTAKNGHSVVALKQSQLSRPQTSCFVQLDHSQRPVNRSCLLSFTQELFLPELLVRAEAIPSAEATSPYIICQPSFSLEHHKVLVDTAPNHPQFLPSVGVLCYTTGNMSAQCRNIAQACLPYRMKLC